MEKEPQFPIRSLPEYSSLHDLLDCYMYLKLYSLWGTERLGDLRDQVALYQHVAKLWKDFGNTRVPSKKSRTSVSDIDQVLITDAVNVLRGDFDRRLKKCCESGDEEQTAEVLAFTLIHDQLLFPSDEFVQSVKEGAEPEGKIPRALVRIWSPVLSIVASHGMSPVLCRGLIAAAAAAEGDSGFRSSHAAEWVDLIFASSVPAKEGVTGKKRKDRKSGSAASVPEPVLPENDSVKWRDLLEEALMSPSRASLRLLPQLFGRQRPRLAASKEKSLLALMGCYLAERPERKASASNGVHETGGTSEPEVKTLSDLVSDGDGASWSSVNTRATEWRACPLGTFPGQADLDMESGWMEDELDETATAKETPYFDVVSIDWPTLVLEEEEKRSRAKKRCSDFDSDPDGESVPAFYRSHGNNGKRLWR